MLTGVADLAVAEHFVLEEVNPGGNSALEALISPAMDAADEVADAVVRGREHVSLNDPKVVSEAVQSVVQHYPENPNVVKEEVDNVLDGIHFVKDALNDSVQEVHEMVDEIYEQAWMRRAEVLSDVPPEVLDAACRGLDRAGEVIGDLRAEGRIPEQVADKILDRFDSLCANDKSGDEPGNRGPANDQVLDQVLAKDQNLL